MAATASSSSSSSSSSLPPKKHDVFLSFRGEDTRRTFTSHLFTALCKIGIRIYIDNELQKGDDISDALTQAIKDSSIAVVIFSENYASSKWCLNELIQILWCKEVQGQLVIPVFYQIDPSDVRNQRRTYMEAFAKHERDFRLNQERVNKWRQALFITANLAGWDSRTFRDDSELIQNIVNHVQEKINLSHPSSLMGLVGIDENCNEIERLLEKVPIIGIWGMGGIGKTTMAKALFTKLSFKFESSCFLENVREEVEKQGLTYVRNNLLFELLKEESFPHRPPNVASNASVMRSLSCKKVFIVLDDVSSWKQLEYLAPYCEYLGPGSKVIITTRHKQLLVIAAVNEIYEAQPLSDRKSVELFNLKAFHSYHAEIGYESLSQRIVHYAKGIPLVLVVLGSFLRSKTPKEWDNALSKLGKSPSEDILEVLKLSSEEIASLELETTRIEILNSSIGHLSKLKQFSLNGSRLKSLPINELCSLRSLEELRLSNCEQLIDKLKLHILFDALRLLQRLHLHGSRNLTELPNSIKHLSGLQVLSMKNCDRLQSLPELPPSIEELDATHCPSLRTITPEYSLSPEEGMMALTPYPSIGYLTKLRKLRLNVSNLMNFSIEQLCYLRSLKELTLLDCGLVIGKSNLLKLFDALRSFVDLYLEGCSNLHELPDNISSLSSLYLLGLVRSNVEYLPSSIKHLLKLDYIYLTNCKRLRSLPELPPFTRYVKATSCLSLEVAFPLTTCRPQRKYLLESLFLENCLKLEHSLSSMEDYAYLSLKRAAYLNRTGAFCYPGRKIPEWVGYNQTTKASSFITIELSSSVNNLLGFVFCSVLPQFTSKPNCRSYLICQIYFEDGEEVRGKGDDMPITDLNSHHVFLWYDPLYSVCILRELIEREDQGIKGNSKLSFEFSVVSYDENYCTTKNDLLEACGVCPIYASEYHNFLQQMEFGLDLGSQKKSGCDNDEHSLCGIMEYASFSLKRVYGNFESFHVSSPDMPNTPAGFLDKTTDTRSVSFQLRYFDDLMGFIFCFVIPQFSSKEKDRSHSSCRCCWSYGFDVEKKKILTRYFEGPRGWHYSMTELNSDNAFQWCDPLFCEFILDQVRRKRVGDMGLLSFEFEFGDCLIKEWGIHPIYASGYNSFLQQKELKLRLGMKRPRDTCDEEELLTLTKKLKASSVQPTDVDELLLSLSELNLEFAKDGTLQK